MPVKIQHLAVIDVVTETPNKSHLRALGGSLFSFVDFIRVLSKVYAFQNEGKFNFFQNAILIKSC